MKSLKKKVQYKLVYIKFSGKKLTTICKMHFSNKFWDVSCLAYYCDYFVAYIFLIVHLQEKLRVNTQNKSLKISI